MSSILFVCLGNICRSPTAEAVFRARAAAAGLLDLHIDSAGTGSWHVGEPPDPRAIAAGAARGYALDGLRGREITVGDFDRFAHILVMDRKNMMKVNGLAPNAHGASVRLFLDYAGLQGAEVPDPYLGEADAFDAVLDMIERASDGLIAALKSPGQAARS